MEATARRISDREVITNDGGKSRRGRGRGGVEGEGEGEGEREMKRGRGGEGRKRSQRTHPLACFYENRVYICKKFENMLRTWQGFILQKKNYKFNFL